MADIADPNGVEFYSEFKPFIVGKASLFCFIYNLQDSNHTAKVDVKFRVYCAGIGMHPHE